MFKIIYKKQSNAIISKLHWLQNWKKWDAVMLFFLTGDAYQDFVGTWDFFLIIKTMDNECKLHDILLYNEWSNKTYWLHANKYTIIYFSMILSFPSHAFLLDFWMYDGICFQSFLKLSIILHYHFSNLFNLPTVLCTVFMCYIY